MAQRNAIVTGGGGGIGGVAARELAGRGLRVLVVDIDGDAAQATVEAIASAGGSAAAHVADVRDEAAVKGYVDACVDRFGAPHAFFNNAAYQGAIAQLPEYPVDEFDRTVAIN